MTVFDFFDKLLNYILPLAGVALGAWLSPFIAIRARKRQIKAELYELLFWYYNAASNHLLCYNYKCIQDHRRSIRGKQLSDDPKADVAVRNEILRQYNHFDKASERHYEQSVNWHTEMMKTRSKISYLFAEAETFYPRKKIAETKVALIRHLNEMKITELMNFDEMNDDKLRKAFDKVYPKVEGSTLQFHEHLKKAEQLLSEALT